MDGKRRAELAVTSQTVGNLHQGLYIEMLQFAAFCPVLILALLAGVISDPSVATATLSFCCCRRCGLCVSLKELTRACL